MGWHGRIICICLEMVLHRRECLVSNSSAYYPDSISMLLSERLRRLKSLKNVLLWLFFEARMLTRGPYGF